MTSTPVEVMPAEGSPEAVIIPAYIRENEKAAIQGMFQQKVTDINTELGLIGQSLFATAEHLHYLRSNLKPKSWTAFTTSNVVMLSPKQCTDLENAWSKWLQYTDFNPALLHGFSSRSLNAMANAAPAARERVYDLLEAGKLEPKESNVRKALNPKRKTKAKKASIVAMEDLPKGTSEKDKLVHACKLIDNLSIQVDSLGQARVKHISEIMKLKGEIANLRAQMKAQKELAA